MKESKEFKERKELALLQQILEKQKHDFKMEELTYQRESDKMHHERELERMRIKTAEIRKDRELRKI